MFCAPALAQEWTRFRGPNGSGLGTAPGLPVKWTDADYKWKVELPGSGPASPVVWGERIFLTSADEQAMHRYIVCLSTADGSLLWKQEFPYQKFARKINAFNGYASSTPAVDEDRVYVCWSQPESFMLAAFDHNGKQVWTYDLGPYESQHGSGTSPILVGDLVVLCNEQDGPRSFLVAVEKKTGQLRWKLDRTSGKTPASTPVVYHPKGGSDQVIFTSTKHGIASIDASSGNEAWSVPDAFNLRCVGSPIVAGDLIIGQCGEGSAGRFTMAVHPGSASEKPQVAYKLNKFVPYVPTPVAKGDLLFLWSDTGTVTCARLSTGEIVWQEKLGQKKAEFFGSPVCVNDNLYCISKTGDVFVVSATEKFALLGQTPLGEPSFATPAISGGNMYLRTTHHLMCLPPKSS
jgi:outer membrane protein assembly factor BamB